jgi:hypothetical protein
VVGGEWKVLRRDDPELGDGGEGDEKEECEEGSDQSCVLFHGVRVKEESVGALL